VEFRSIETATNTAVYETEPVVSSLSKETVFGLMTSLAEGTIKHFSDTGPRRLRVAEAVRRVAWQRALPILPRLRTLDASAAFERGINAYEQLEFETARQAFEKAAEQDARNPVAQAWLSRTAQIVGQGDAARQAADQAIKLISAQTTEADRKFVAAVSAEALGDFASARTHYQELASAYADEPFWLIEQAAFEDRHGKVSDAITLYRRALALDARLARPHLESCKLYNRTSESVSAEVEARAALSAYR